MAEERRNLLREGSDGILDAEQPIYIMLLIDRVYDVPRAGIHDAVCALRKLLQGTVEIQNNSGNGRWEFLQPKLLKSCLTNAVRQCTTHVPQQLRGVTTADVTMLDKGAKFGGLRNSKSSDQPFFETGEFCSSPHVVRDRTNAVFVQGGEQKVHARNIGCDALIIKDRVGTNVPASGAKIRVNAHVGHRGDIATVGGFAVAESAAFMAPGRGVSVSFGFGSAMISGHVEVTSLWWYHN